VETSAALVGSTGAGSMLCNVTTVILPHAENAYSSKVMETTFSAQVV
jgi:hypothetical protein